MGRPGEQLSGFTLVELLVSMVIFSIVLTICYSTYLTISRIVTRISDSNAVSDRAQRLMTFIEEDLRGAGYLVSPDSGIPYCSDPADTSSGTKVISHSRGNPSDTLSFIHAVPVVLDESSRSCIDHQKECPPSGDPTSGSAASRQDYYLTTRCDSGAGTGRPNSIAVDAVHDCYDSLLLAAVGASNSKSLVTFQTASGDGACYQVTGIDNGIFTLIPELKQLIPDNSTVFTLRQYRYDVVTTPAAEARTFRRSGWKSDCTLDPVAMGEPTGDGGGVDGLKFEFTSYNPLTERMELTAVPPASLKNLRCVTVWLLLRAERKTPDYLNNNRYVLGNSVDQTVVGPFNDSYIRSLTYRTVEVRNFSSGS